MSNCESDIKPGTHPSPYPAALSPLSSNITYASLLHGCMIADYGCYSLVELGAPGWKKRVDAVVFIFGVLDDHVSYPRKLPEKLNYFGDPQLL